MGIGDQRELDFWAGKGAPPSPDAWLWGMEVGSLQPIVSVFETLGTCKAAPLISG